MPTPKALELARIAIEQDDPCIYDVAANCGQIVGNVRNTHLFLELVADWIEEEGIAEYSHLVTRQDYPSEFYQSYHLLTLAKVARLLERPTEGALAWVIWTISTDAPVAQAIEFMQAAGYVPFVGYPLTRQK